VNGDAFIAAAVDRGYTVREITNRVVVVSRKGVTYRLSIFMVEESSDDEVFALLDERDDPIAALELISRGHRATVEEREEWRFRPRGG
jgi:hypothetical protein